MEKSGTLHIPPRQAHGTQTMSNPADPHAILVLTTCPDETCAERISQALVSEGLAACVGRLPGMTSVYRWQGAIEQAVEYQLLVKASSTVQHALIHRLKTLHPYEVPEILVLQISDGLPAYLQWLQTDDTNRA